MNKGKNVLWNMIGSSLTAASTLIFTISATRILGEESGGIVGLAIGISFIMATFGYFEIRPFQSTDIKEQFLFQDYFAQRIISCLVMMVITIVYVVCAGYKGEKAAIVIGFCLFKMIDCFSDVFQGMLQQKGRLDLAGKALSLRLALSMVLFIAGIMIYGNLTAVTFAMTILAGTVVLIYDVSVTRGYTPIKPDFDKEKLGRLIRKSTPLFIISFIEMYTANISKMCIDHYIPEQQVVWNALFVPASVINLFSIFIFRPTLTLLAEKWLELRLKEFTEIIIKLVGWILFVTLAAIIGGIILGIPVLELLYGLELKEWRGILPIVLCGGCFNAIAILLYYMTTIMRIQNKVCLCDVTVFLFSTVSTVLLVKAAGLWGAAVSYVAVMLLRSVLIGNLARQEIKEKRRISDIQ